MLCEICLLQSCQQFSIVGRVSSIVQMRRSRLREAKSLAPGHLVAKLQSCPDSGGFTLISLPTCLHEGFASKAEGTCSLTGKSGKALPPPALGALLPDSAPLSGSLSIQPLSFHVFRNLLSPRPPRASCHSFPAGWPPLIQTLQALLWDQFPKIHIGSSTWLKGRATGSWWGPVLTRVIW